MGIESEEGYAALAEIRAICARLPEMEERPSHQTPTFFVRGRKTLVHLWEHHHGEHGLALWCPAPPGVQGELVDQEPDRFFVPPYVGHRGWIGMRLDVDPDWDEVAEMLVDAYRLVAPKSLVRRLDEARP